MDDFWRERSRFGSRPDAFFDDSFPQFRSPFFESPFSVLHNSMHQIHREMDEMMRNAFGNFPIDNVPLPPAIDGHRKQPQIVDRSLKDQDLDKQVQKYGIKSIFDEPDYDSEWDFVKKLEQLEKQQPKSTILTDGNRGYYGRSQFYNYTNTGDGKLEERKVVQDSRGNRMETVKRQLGDKIWAKTTKQREGGEMDEDERMFNMEEQDKEKFIQDWRSMNHRGISNAYRNAFNDQTNENKLNMIDMGNEKPTSQTTDKTLPSLEQKNSKGWLGYLKFW